MTKEEAIKRFEEENRTMLENKTAYINGLKARGMKYEGRMVLYIDEAVERNELAISALKGLDLPDNATNEDALNYMLRQTFPKVIFIHFHNEANLTEGVVMSKEWLDSPYKVVNE